MSFKVLWIFSSTIFDGLSIVHAESSDEIVFVDDMETHVVDSGKIAAWYRRYSDRILTPFSGPL